MTRRLVKRPQAYRDVVELADYIAKDSLTAAIRFTEAFDSTCELLQATPGLGSRWEGNSEKHADLFFWPIQGFPSYLIFYQPIRDGIEIVRVFRGSRDLENIL